MVHGRLYNGRKSGRLFHSVAVGRRCQSHQIFPGVLDLSKRLLSLAAGVALLVAGASLTGFPQTRPPAAKAPARPRLVLLITIDQFRADYLDRFRPYFVAGGFNRLMSGARFTQCHYDYASTTTGPGHATLATGAYPNHHGIIGNAWYDRSLKRPVSCVEDLNTRIVDSAEGSRDQRGASPRWLMGSTLTDELRIATNFQSKVVSIALKDRGAVLPGGHNANAAYWYDGKAGAFVSSTYYMPTLPSWVADFNARAPARDYCGKPWKALGETPGAEGRVFREYRATPDETCPSPRFLDWLGDTPHITEIELRFAREAIRQEKLGQGPGTDMLTLALCANDFIGHRYGPNSTEVADMTLRTDRELAGFLDDLDRMVGLNHVWIALTADHGVAPTPKFIKDRNLGLGQFESKPVQDAVQTRLSKVFGEEKWIESYDTPYIYLNQEALAKRQVSPEKASEEAAQAAIGAPGVFAAFTRSGLSSGNVPDSAIARKVLNGFNLRRGGDVFIVLEPYAVSSGSETGTNHGTPWNYDAHVPILLWGSAFRPGEYAGPCDPVDLAVTLAAALGIEGPSGAVGAPLLPALAPKR